MREILGEIRESTNGAVLVTEEGTKGVEVGSQRAAQAGQVIHRIAAEVESGAQANVQIAAAAQQQTAGMEQISQAMVSIQQATTQALASPARPSAPPRTCTRWPSCSSRPSPSTVCKMIDAATQAEIRALFHAEQAEHRQAIGE